MQANEKTLILTLGSIPRARHFLTANGNVISPPEHNLLDAHLTLFHQLPDSQTFYTYFAGLQCSSFTIQITGLMNLGAGVAYRVESQELTALQKQLRFHFQELLIPQDLQGYRPHITIMNKSTPEMARVYLPV